MNNGAPRKQEVFVSDLKENTKATPTAETLAPTFLQTNAETGKIEPASPDYIQKMLRGNRPH